jgi:hypothetical protein
MAGPDAAGILQTLHPPEIRKYIIFELGLKKT